MTQPPLSPEALAEIEKMKKALGAQMRVEHDAGYVLVRAPLITPPNACHACGSPQVVDFAPMFERDAATMRSYMHIAMVCATCKGDEVVMAALGDRIVAHGQTLFDEYGDAVVVKMSPVPSA